MNIINKTIKHLPFWGSLWGLLIFSSCASKKEVSEQTEAKEQLQTTAVSFSQQQVYDSLLSSFNISIDRLFVQTDKRLTTVRQNDSVDCARDHASPHNTTIVAEGVRLEKIVSSQKNSSAKQSSQADTVSYKDIVHTYNKDTVNKTATSFNIVVPLILLVLLVGGAYLLYRRFTH